MQLKKSMSLVNWYFIWIPLLLFEAASAEKQKVFGTADRIFFIIVSVLGGNMRHKIFYNGRNQEESWVLKLERRLCFFSPPPYALIFPLPFSGPPWGFFSPTVTKCSQKKFKFQKKFTLVLIERFNSVLFIYLFITTAVTLRYFIL